MNIFMKENLKAIKFGLLGGLAEALYIGLVVTLIWTMDQSKPELVFPMAGFLLILFLFVVSAGVSGLFVFGYPLYLFLNKNFTQGLAAAISAILALMLVGISCFVVIFFLI